MLPNVVKLRKTDIEDHCQKMQQNSMKAVKRASNLSVKNKSKLSKDIVFFFKNKYNIFKY